MFSVRRRSGHGLSRVVSAAFAAGGRGGVFGTRQGCHSPPSAPHRGEARLVTQEGQASAGDHARRDRRGAPCRLVRMGEDGRASDQRSAQILSCANRERCLQFGRAAELRRSPSRIGRGFAAESACRASLTCTQRGQDARFRVPCLANLAKHQRKRAKRPIGLSTSPSSPQGSRPRRPRSRAANL